MTKTCNNCIYNDSAMCPTLSCCNCPNDNDGCYCYKIGSDKSKCTRFVPLTKRIRVNPEVIDGKFEMSQKDYDKVIADHGYIGYYQYDVNIKETGKRYGVRVGFFDKRFYRNKFFITVEEGNYEILD